MAKKTRQAPSQSRPPNLIETLSRYWQKRLVRVLVALLVLGGAIFLQYRLANIALPVDVEKATPPYTPQSAELVKQEELIIDDPTINRSGPVPNSRMLFSGDGAEFVSVEARFDSAVIGKNFTNILRTDPDQQLPPDSQQPISYTPESDQDSPEENNGKDAPNSAPCRTSVDIALTENGSMPAELHVFQQTPGSERSRVLEMRATGADLVITLLTKNFSKGEGGMQGLNCAKTLTVGSWSESFSAPAPVDIVVPAGTTFRLLFNGAEGKISSAGATKYYEPFKLVGLPLNARAVRKVKLRAATPAVFEAARVEGQPPLILRYLKLGPDDVQLDFAGQAMVKEKGKFAVTFSLLQFAKANPILAGILAMFDAALLEWIRRSLMGYPESLSQEQTAAAGADAKQLAAD